MHMMLIIMENSKFGKEKKKNETEKRKTENVDRWETYIDRYFQQTTETQRIPKRRTIETAESKQMSAVGYQLTERKNKSDMYINQNQDKIKEKRER